MTPLASLGTTTRGDTPGYTARFAGGQDSAVARVERLVSTFVLGCAISEAGGRFDRRDWRERRALLEGVDLPAHRKLANQLESPWSWDAEFETDLDDLVRLVENGAGLP